MEMVLCTCENEGKMKEQTEKNDAAPTQASQSFLEVNGTDFSVGWIDRRFYPDVCRIRETRFS